MTDTTKKAGLWRWIAVLTILAALLVALAGPLNRTGALDWRPALTLMRYAAMAAGLGALLCLIGAVVTRPSTRRRGFRLALAGLVLGAAAFAVPLSMMMTARSVPPIHDISTDTQDPPQFDEVIRYRAGAANPPAYPGGDVARQQQAAYPDIKPIILANPPKDVFRRAQIVADGLGWEIVEVNGPEGKIEATDTTTWFGFKDDVVIRLRPHGSGTRVDVRSKSRVGMSDLGANAARIRRFAERLSE